jgi:hypothetical protein
LFLHVSKESVVVTLLSFSFQIARMSSKVARYKIMLANMTSVHSHSEFIERCIDGIEVRLLSSLLDNLSYAEIGMMQLVSARS